MVSFKSVFKVTLFLALSSNLSYSLTLPKGFKLREGHSLHESLKRLEEHLGSAKGLDLASLSPAELRTVEEAVKGKSPNEADAIVKSKLASFSSLKAIPSLMTSINSWKASASTLVPDLTPVAAAQQPTNVVTGVTFGGNKSHALNAGDNVEGSLRFAGDNVRFTEGTKSLDQIAKELGLPQTPDKATLDSALSEMGVSDASVGQVKLAMMGIHATKKLGLKSEGIVPGNFETLARELVDPKPDANGDGKVTAEEAAAAIAGTATASANAASLASVGVEVAGRFDTDGVPGLSAKEYQSFLASVVADYNKTLGLSGDNALSVKDLSNPELVAGILDHLHKKDGDQESYREMVAACAKKAA